MTFSSGIQELPDETFWDCSSLKEITLPEGMTTIGERAFEECSSLEKVGLPQSMQTIGVKAFYECTKLSEITLPEGLTGIGEQAFRSCSALKQIAIPKGIKTIETGTFRECKNLSELHLGEGLTEIAPYAFENCYALTEIQIPEGITRIEKNAFKSNTIVEKICIPTGVTSIGEYAFYNCSNLRKISIPETVESIASNAFSGKKELLIYGVEGSYAESYASEKKIAFSTKTFPENENQILECAKTSYKVAQGDSSFNLNVEQTYGNGKVTYQSSDKNVVSVSSTGVVSIKGPGVAQITVKAAKTINYDEETLKVKVTVNPKESHITSKKVNARKWTLKWIKDSKVTGYQIQYSTDKKFKKSVKKVTLKKNSTTTWTSPKLTVGKTYYARVRSYKTVKVNGKSQNLYSRWCDTVSTGKVKKK